MLNLTFAPSADTLVPLAERRIREAWPDPFDPPPVIVPNPAVGKWLTIRLAESPSFKCVANARMLTLEKFLWDALDPEQKMVLLDAERLSQMICAVLDEKLLAGKHTKDDIYAPLRRYLCEQIMRNAERGTRNDRHRPIRGSISADSCGIDVQKLVQLSERIAQLFIEYQYNRPSVWDEGAKISGAKAFVGFNKYKKRPRERDNETGGWKSHGIDAMWGQGKEYFGGEEHEAWQMDLYRRLLYYLSDHFDPPITLPHLYRYRRATGAKENSPWCDVGRNRQIILFGVSKISHFHRNTLVEISQTEGADMHVFLTNPCAEFWEDVDTSRRSFKPRRRWNSKSPDKQAGIKPVKLEDYNKSELSEIDMFADKPDHALLELWGGAGKENIFLWCPQAQWNFE
jgi:exonuclease V gamma subunit